MADAMVNQTDYERRLAALNATALIFSSSMASGAVAVRSSDIVRFAKILETYLVYGNV